MPFPVVAGSPGGVQEVLLQPTPGEAAFYNEIRDDGRTARATLQALLSCPDDSESYYVNVDRARTAAEVCPPPPLSARHRAWSPLANAFAQECIQGRAKVRGCVHSWHVTHLCGL